jgi:hypothetical protein
MAPMSMILLTGLESRTLLDGPSQPGIYGKQKVYLLNIPPPRPANHIAEVIMQNIIQRGSAIVQKYSDPVIGAPDPSFVLQLSDDAYTGSNLYAVQKMFDGQFQFDVARVAKYRVINFSVDT